MTKREKIAQTFREEIASGVLKPGTRLPVRAKIEKRFRASLVTVQRAMEQLIAEGWVSAHGRGGTRVAEIPPHLNHYGLLFPFRPAEENGGARLWRVILRAAKEVLNKAPANLSVFYGVDMSASLGELLAFHEMLQAQRLAGLIMVSWPVPQVSTFLERGTSLPCAAFVSRPVPGLLSLSILPEHCLEQACRLLAERGRRRLAALMPTPFFTAENLAEARATMQQHGLDAQPGRIQPFVDWRNPEALFAQVELLLAGSKRSAPNALYLGDDNLVEPVADALRRLGKRVPEDVELACWGTMPWPETYSIPFHRIGIDIRPLIHAAKDGIDRARRGEKLPGAAEASQAEILKRDAAS